MSPLAPAAKALADHPWLDGAWAGTTGALLLLSRHGQAEFHREGRQSLLDTLQSQLATRDLALPRTWRLLDTPPPATDHATIERLLATPRPRQVIPIAEKEDAGRWKLELVLPSDLILFDDHFRKAPVLPGGVQVAWALALAAPRLGTSNHCREMEALKFQRLLRPGDLLQLDLHYEDEPGEPLGKLHFAYRLAGQHCSSGRLRVTLAHG
jgi:3-hydroxymyristoyl/3-hydroxydecanoyl-(acyl carrier protein) dehydratase